MSLKSHWERIYSGKQSSELSWHQAIPKVSLDFLKELEIPKSASIIDVGGGESHFVDLLLKMGYTDITILDISETAIDHLKKRLGESAEMVKWINSDITKLSLDKKFDFWHDRATFHFLTSEVEADQYLSVAEKHISENGKMLIGTFSTSGPEKCSGLRVKQYSAASLTRLLKKWFEKIKCISVNHETPFNTIQNFLFCSFKKIKIQ